MSKVFPIILLIFGCFSLFILYLNRGSSRIHEATVVIAGVIITTLLILTKKESLQKNIYSVYFVNNKENDLLWPSIPGSSLHNFIQGAVWNKYKENLSLDNKKIDFDFHKDTKALVDLQAVGIINYLNEYSKSWYVERESKDLPLGTRGSSRFETEKIKNDITKFSKDTLPSSIKNNVFYKEIVAVQPIAFAMPKGTKIEYSSSKEGVFYTSELRFYKRFAFDIRIKIGFVSYTIGLGIVGDYLGITKPGEPISADDPNVKEYGHFVVLVECKADFFRWRTWDPSVVLYRRWAEDLFQGLYESFDWSIYQDKIQKSQQIKANLKIINQM